MQLLSLQFLSIFFGTKCKTKHFSLIRIKTTEVSQLGKRYKKPGHFEALQPVYHWLLPEHKSGYTERFKSSNPESWFWGSDFDKEDTKINIIEIEPSFAAEHSAQHSFMVGVLCVWQRLLRVLKIIENSRTITNQQEKTCLILYNNITTSLYLSLTPQKCYCRKKLF